MEVMKIFEEKFRSVIKDNVKSVLLEGGEESEAETVPTKKSDWKPQPSSLSCFYCQSTFGDANDHKGHSKSDWHRYNLKRSLLSKAPVTEDEFSEKAGLDDISSISGSDSENGETLDTYATAQGKIFLQNNEGKVFSIYTCLLCTKKEELTDEVISTRLKDCCVNNKKWAILMLGGGHFAGAVFNGDEPVLHKTFHCYTVRAGQGGTQSTRDNKTGGSHPKSAGASLRRYNEQAFVQHVKAVIDTWKTELDQAALIIYRASGPYNRSVLFGGSPPLLDRADNRLRTIPFSTRRATFTEVKRVHSVLTLAYVYVSVDSALGHFSRHKQPEQNAKRNKTRSSCINRAKSREIVERPLPVDIVDDSSESLEDLNNFTNLSTEDQDIYFRESLQEFEDTLTPEQRKRPTKRSKPKKSKTRKLKEQEQKRKTELVDILCRGDVDKLQKLLKNSLKVDEENGSDQAEPKNDFVNEVLDDDGNTLLHIAAMNEQNEILQFLLENEANPCLKNQKQYTPYTCTKSKEIRETLKTFARSNPDKYNYNKAQIPTNVLDPEEVAKKKEIQKKAKKEKEKIKKEELRIKKQEEEEKGRFLKLSDREKRALAAERRILSQSGAVTARCFLCGADISGKVPFEYLNNRFCSVDCLKAHRLQNPIVLS